MALNLDDPASWPTDDSELVKLADDFPASSDPADPTTELAATPESADTLGTPPADPPRDELGRFTKPETPEAEDAPVLTADGKHYIPHSVLKETRERAQQAEALIQERDQLLAQYQQQLAALQAAQALPAVEAPPQPGDRLQELLDTPVTLTAEQQARIEQTRRDWGEDQAEALQQSFTALRRTEVQDQVLRAYQQALVEQRQFMAELQNRMAQQQQQEQQSEGEQIQAAIDASPLMAAWQADRHGPYFDHSVKLHQYMMTADAEYARLSWPERMAVLPAKVQALHGQSPHQSRVGAVGEVIPPVKPAKPAEPRIPLSHSDIAAGGVPPTLSDIEKLERLTPVQMQQHLMKMGPDELRDYLMQFG